VSCRCKHFSVSKCYALVTASTTSISSRLAPLQLSGIYALDHGRSTSELSGTPLGQYPTGYLIKRLITHPTESAVSVRSGIETAASTVASAAMNYTNDGINTLQANLQTEAGNYQELESSADFKVYRSFGFSNNGELLEALQPVMAAVQQAISVDARLAGSAASSGSGSGLTNLLSADSTTSLLKASLDSDAATNIASNLLDVGEKMVEKLESIRNLDQVQSMLSMTQTDAQASLMLSTIEGVDADEALSLATNALTGT
jgi:hypothetical protein